MKSAGRQALFIPQPSAMVGFFSKGETGDLTM
jgi:hypothetical protein